MGSHSELAFLDATAQAELVQNKEVQPIELVEAAIKRIEKLNPETPQCRYRCFGTKMICP